MSWEDSTSASSIRSSPLFPTSFSIVEIPQSGPETSFRFLSEMMEHRSGVTAYRSIDRPLNVHLLAPCFSFPGSSFLSSRHSSQHQLYAPFCSPLYALSLPPSASLSLSLLELTPLLRSPELSESMRFDANPASFWETVKVENQNQTTIP
jgi:hypothetical protein